MSDTREPRSHSALRILLILVGFAALIAGYRHMAKRGADIPPMNEVERVADITRKDKETLLNKNARDTEVFGALVRLGQREEPLARQEAVRRADSPSKMVREGVANALGGFDDVESLDTLKKLLA